MQRRENNLEYVKRVQSWQIRSLVEYNVSYVYHSLCAYFDRDNVALKSLAKL
ncbi:Ferritin [Corchorus olitorius]|uniref:Ferritin n=1 Tax=Corchorus olitorius TaxID=93759 RepID=A0A1R3GA08_9ROSI|nr:Ferritin [Corchorus olitorius]